MIARVKQDLEDLVIDYRNGNASCFYELYQACEPKMLMRLHSEMKKSKYLDPYDLQSAVDDALLEALEKYDPCYGTFEEQLNRHITWKFSGLKKHALTGERLIYLNMTRLDEKHGEDFTLSDTLKARYNHEKVIELNEIKDRVNAVFEDTDRFPERSMVEQVVEYRKGNMDALGIMFELTKGIRNEIGYKLQSLFHNVHKNDIDTGLVDALIYFASYVDLDKCFKPGKIEKFYMSYSWYRSRKWIEINYPWLRNDPLLTDYWHKPPKLIDPFEEQEQIEEATKRISQVMLRLDDLDYDILYRKMMQGKKDVDIIRELKTYEVKYYRHMRKIKRVILEEMQRDDFIADTKNIIESFRRYFSAERREALSA